MYNVNIGYGDHMKDKRAFTLIELLAVIVIMGILLTITIPQLIKNLKDKKDVALETIKETIVSIGKNYAIDKAWEKDNPLFTRVL